MKNELISIIIPAFNIEQYIERCLKSVINQTYSEIEIIVVDDGSTDKTSTIIDFVAEHDSRIKVIHKKNGGVSQARIDGIHHASGEWIGFVDGDDYVEPHMFEYLIRNAIQYQADISHCGYQMIFPNGHIDYYYNTGIVEKQNHEKAMQELLSGERVEPGLWNKLFRKSLFQHVLSKENILCKIKINEDLLMNYWLFKAAKNSIYEDICLYHYLLRKGSAATTKQRNHITEPLYVWEMIKNDLYGNDNLYSIAYMRYLRILIGVATQIEWKAEGRNALTKLRQEVKRNNIRICSLKKLKMMAIVAAYAMPIYRLMRKSYDKKTGNSKKYDI